MTEETIEKLLKEKYSAKVANPDKAFIQNTSLVDSACEAIKQLLEQHEAEMVEFAEWTSHNALVMITKKAWCKRVGYDSPILKCGEIKTTTDLLTLFKNRNK